MSINDENLIREQFRGYSMQELWEIADCVFTFSADTPDEWVRGHRLQRQIADELTGYSEFYARRAPPLPSDPRWVMGREGGQDFEWLRANHPGIPDYCRWARTVPPQFTLMQVARFDLWRQFEDILVAAHRSGELIDDWRDLERDLLCMAVRDHLAAREAATRAPNVDPLTD